MAKRVVKAQKREKHLSAEKKSNHKPSRFSAHAQTRHLSSDLYSTAGLTGMNDLMLKVERLWLKPGLFLLDTWRELGEAPKQQIIDEFNLTIESQSGSERAGQWWAAFRSEKAEHPGLIERVIAELKIRDSHIGEFFLAYVYSSTNNIAANLFLVDMVRSKKGEMTNAWVTRNIVRARERLAVETVKHYQLDCKASRIANNFLNEFSRGSRTWSDSDILALMWLVESDIPLTHLMYLASIAESFRPFTIFYLLQVLRSDRELSWSINLHNISSDVDKVGEWLTGDDVIEYSMHLEFFKKLDCPTSERLFDYCAGASFSNHFTEFSRPLIESILGRLRVEEPITQTLAEQISKSFAYLVDESEIISRLTQSSFRSTHGSEL